VNLGSAAQADLVSVRWRAWATLCRELYRCRPDATLGIAVIGKQPPSPTTFVADGAREEMNCQTQTEDLSMTSNRVLTVLIAATLVMQAVILYRQTLGPSGRRPQEIVADASNSDPVDLSGVPMRGAAEARVVIVEFSDFECPFCMRHATSVAHEIEKRFVTTGRIRTAFMHNPLPSHLNAKLLGTAAFCAHEQHRFWDMHRFLFETKPTTKEEIVAALESQSLDVSAFQGCLEGPAARERIERDTTVAQRLGLQATPSFAVAIIDERGRGNVKKIIRGAQPLSVFETVINDVSESGMQQGNR